MKWITVFHYHQYPVQRNELCIRIHSNRIVECFVGWSSSKAIVCSHSFCLLYIPISNTIRYQLLLANSAEEVIDKVLMAGSVIYIRVIETEEIHFIHSIQVHIGVIIGLLCNSWRLQKEEKIYHVKKNDLILGRRGLRNVGRSCLNYRESQRGRYRKYGQKRKRDRKQSQCNIRNK